MHEPRHPFKVAVATTILSPYERDIVRGVIRYSDQNGPWRFCGVSGVPYLPFGEIDLARVNGVIGGFYCPEWVDVVSAAGVLAANTANRFSNIGLPRVGVDDEAVGRWGAEHLLERGYPQFGFLKEGGNWYSDRRLEGFREVIEQKAGRSCHITQITGYQLEHDPERIADWLKQLPTPIGIMVATDVIARAVVDRAADLGLRVPDEVGVLGVDNNEMVSAIARTPLSSVRLNGLQVGYRAAQMLDMMAAGKTPDSPCWIQPLGIELRHSTDIVATEDARVTKALRFIRDYCGEPITVDDVLSAVYMSRTSLEVRMKRAIGKTPWEAINSARVERAKGMLTGSTATISEIGDACGFPRPERFSVVFKRLTGMSPSQFRQNLRTQ